MVPDSTSNVQIHTPVKGITDRVVLCHKTDVLHHLSQFINP